ncbi:MAG: hypothetical protein J5680_01390, partial [Neisseriaceae bacterium]|nr:hypothetical protein [Neisseriaceae bacterium]
MKKNLAFLMILGVFLGGCSKEKSAQQLMSKCDDPIAVQMLKNQVLQTKSLCKDPKDELDLYCHVEKGEFKNFKITDGSSTHNSCYVEYNIIDGVGFVFNYEVRLEN